MNQIIGMVEAKSKLAELVGRVKYGGQRFVLERRGRPMAMLISVEEFELLQAQAGAAAGMPPSPLPPALRLRQEGLLARARSLREHMVAPEDRLAEMFADLPPDDHEFWVEVQELS